MLCRVRGPIGAMWGRFRKVLARTEARGLGESDMVYRGSGLIQREKLKEDSGDRVKVRMCQET